MLNIYGSVESRTSNDSVLEKWDYMLDIVSKIASKGEWLIIIGDLNVHIGSLVQSNMKTDISFGGQLVKDFVSSGDYILVNSSEKVTGGPYTRIDPAFPHNESVLDLCIVSRELYAYLDKLVIDKERYVTPFRAVSKSKIVFSDH